jgi:hypothetical protein
VTVTRSIFGIAPVGFRSFAVYSTVRLTSHAASLQSIAASSATIHTKDCVTQTLYRKNVSSQPC